VVNRVPEGIGDVHRDAKGGAGQFRGPEIPSHRVRETDFPGPGVSPGSTICSCDAEAAVTVKVEDARVNAGRDTSESVA